MRKFHDEYLKENIIYALGSLRATEAKDILIEATKDPNEKIKKAATAVLQHRITLNEQVDKGQKVELGIKKPTPVIDLSPYLKELKNKDYKIRRKVADDLGDSGNQKVTKYLIPFLKDKNEYVRQAAARALGKLKDKEAVEPLIETLKDSDIDVVAFTTWALGEIKDPRAIEPLAPLLLNEEEKIRDGSFEALRKFEDPAAKKAMVKTLINSDWMLKRLISLEGDGVVLKTFEDPKGDNAKTVRNYIRLMTSGNSDVRGIVNKALKDNKDRELIISEVSNRIKEEKDDYLYISFLGNLDDKRGLPILIETLKNRKAAQKSNGVVAIDAIEKLGGSQQIQGILMEILVDASEGATRERAARAIGKLGDKNAVEPLIKIVQDKKEDNHIRIGAAGALGGIKDKRALEPLINALKDDKEDVWVRVAAVSSIGEIGGESVIGIIQDAATNDSTGYIKHAAEIALRKIKTGK